MSLRSDDEGGTRPITAKRSQTRKTKAIFWALLGLILLSNLGVGGRLFAGETAVMAFALAIGIAAAILLVFMVVSAVLGKMKSRNPMKEMLGILLILALMMLPTAAGAALLTPLMLEIPVSFESWAAIFIGSTIGLVFAFQRSGYGIDGCLKMIVVAWAYYGICWSGLVIATEAPPVSGWEALQRLALVSAVPSGLLALPLVRKDARKGLRTWFGIMAITLPLLSLAFLPLERGFGSELLPQSDWLRFPIGGAVMFGLFPVLLVPFGFLFGQRVLPFSKLWRGMMRFASIGALFGLLWAATRVLI